MKKETKTNLFTEKYKYKESGIVGTQKSNADE